MINTYLDVFSIVDTTCQSYRSFTFRFQCGWTSAGRAVQLAIRSEGRWFKSQLPWAELSCMSKCPWERYWSPYCSWGPCDELATCPRCTLPSPGDSLDWLQQQTPRLLDKRDKAVTDDDMTFRFHPQDLLPLNQAHLLTKIAKGQFPATLKTTYITISKTMWLVHHKGISDPCCTVAVWLGLGTKTNWLGLGKHYGFSWSNYITSSLHKLTYISTLHDVKCMTLLNNAGKFKELWTRAAVSWIKLLDLLNEDASLA